MDKAKALVGAAGEHYIAFQLSARGYAVGFTARGTSGADLLATNLETGKSITVQVKTASKAFRSSKKRWTGWSWRVGIKRAHPQPAFFYLFVDLKLLEGNLSESPDIFVVPSQDLEPALEYWPSPDAPKDVWCCIDVEDKEKYINRWEVIVNALS